MVDVNSSSAPVRAATRTRSFAEAIAAYHDARPAETFEILRGHLGVAAALLRARAALRLGDPQAAFASLERIDDSTLSHLRLGEVLTLRSASLTLMRRWDESQDTLAHARAYVYGAGCIALEAEYELFEGIRAIESGDAHAMERPLRCVFELDPNAPDDRSHYFVALRNTRARAHHALGVLAARREAYREQAEHIHIALAEIDASPQPDLWVTASTLFNLAIHVREYDLASVAKTIEARIDGVEWPSEIAAMRSEIHRCLGWSRALRGDSLGAFRAFRLASECALSPEREILSITDLAYLGRELGESARVAGELRYAARLADVTNWESTGEERYALLALSREIAKFDAARARTLFERYRNIASRLSPLLLNTTDRRLRAQEAHAEGVILRACGDSDAARVAFSRAFEIWKAIGYRWRAASAAIELAELGAGAAFVTYAKSETTIRPHAWLARRAAALPESPSSLREATFGK